MGRQRARTEIPQGRMPSECPDEEWIDYETPMGRVVYGPQYSDEHYVYRHVRVSSKIFKHAQHLMAQKPNRLLSMEEVTQRLGIQMSVDWQHVLTHTRAHELFFKRKRRDVQDDATNNENAQP